MFTDSHAHITKEFYEDIEAVIKNAKIKPASHEAGFLLLVINKLDFINFGEVDFHFCGSTKEDGFEFNNFGISIDGENTTFGAF